MINTKTKLQKIHWFPALILTGVVCMGLAGVSNAAPALTFSPSIQIDRRTDEDGTGWGPIAIDGKGNIFSNYYSDTSSGFAMFFNRSTDAGISFKANDTQISDFGWNVYPSIAADNKGHIYNVWEADGNCFNRSNDSGATFEGITSPTGGDFCGFPQIASDNTGGVYIARHNWESITVDISHNAGANFNVHKQVSGTGRAVDSDIAADDHGNVYVVYGNADGGDPKFYFTRSTDSGNTWSTPKLLGQLGGCLRFWRHPTVAAIGSRVYVAWTRGGNQFDVLLLASSDHGATFGPEVKVNGATPQSQAADCPPNPGVAGEGDQVYVGWSTMETANVSKIWVSASENNGANFAVPVRVDDSNNASLGFGDGNLAVHAGQVFASYQIYDPAHNWRIRFARSENTSAPTTCSGLQCTIKGKGNGKVITGTDGDDVICGSAKTDVILGKGGNDTICAGPGNDYVLAGDGHDRVNGGIGSDFIDGGLGFDVLDGMEQNDVLLGRIDNDVLFGGNGSDILSGGDGANLVNGGADKDICEKNASSVAINCEIKAGINSFDLLNLRPELFTQPALLKLLKESK